MSESKWQPIETAPKDGTKIVIAEFDEHEKRWLFRTDHWRKYLMDFDEGWGGLMVPTHWMPLPPLPEEVL